MAALDVIRCFPWHVREFTMTFTEQGIVRDEAYFRALAERERADCLLMVVAYQYKCVVLDPLEGIEFTAADGERVEFLKDCTQEQVGAFTRDLIDAASELTQWSDSHHHTGQFSFLLPRHALRAIVEALPVEGGTRLTLSVEATEAARQEASEVLSYRVDYAWEHDTW